MAWWNELVLTEQILLCIAIPSSLFLVIQMILIMVGAAGGDGLDTDTDVDFDYSSGPKDFGVASMFSLQGVASFLCVFGWGSLLVYRATGLLVLGIFVGAVLGFIVMYALAKIMMYLNRLAHNGTLDVKNLLGNSGTVYLKIPPKGEGRGKVMVQTSERLVEFDAVSESEDYIANNAEVRVIDILGENVLVVERQ